MKTYKRKWRKLKKRVAALERKTSTQQLWLELLYEFCRSTAHKEGMCLLSYQQLYSPSANSCEKVRMLLNQIRKL